MATQRTPLPEVQATKPIVTPIRRVPEPVPGTRHNRGVCANGRARRVLLAWPMVNTYNRGWHFQQAPEPGHLGGIMPLAPLNLLSMLTDYVEPSERDVACPNQDVVYGAGIVALDLSPVVVQVPEFGERFWVYQIVDLRTDSLPKSDRCTGPSPVLSAGGTELERSNTERHHKNVPSTDEHRPCRPARRPGRHSRGQSRSAVGNPGHRIYPSRCSTAK